MPTIGAGRTDQRVATEDEFRAAIGIIALGGPTDDETLSRTAGSSITIAANIVIKSPIVIPRNCFGLQIHGSGLLVASGVVSSLFSIAARFMLFDRVFSVSTDTSNMFSTFAEYYVDEFDAPGFNTFRHCVASADRFVVDISSGVGGSLIDGCRHVHINSSHAAPVVFLSTDNRVLNCIGLNDGGGDTVTLGSGAADCTITGNDFDGGNFTSTASSGGNTFIGNTNVGTITKHVLDSCGLNT